MFKTYYYLAKPGIIYGNLITTIAGFLLASKGHIDWALFPATLLGISLVMASGCVFNNVFDREIDSKMARTKNRVLVTGRVAKGNAITYGILLGLIGAALLYFYANRLALAVALVGWLVYVCVYTPMKTRSMHATLVGSIAGAVPPVVGYAAVTNRLDLGALILFIILVSWQMPHFYAIAIRRLDEYAEAHVPVLPIKKGIQTTKITMLVYIIIFTFAASLLTVYKFTGVGYLVIALLLGLAWLGLCLKGFRPQTDNQLWARRMFLFSLVVLMVLSITISISGIIHI